MRGLSGIVGLAVLVAACDRPQPVAIGVPPPTPYPPPQYAAAQYPPPSPPQYGAPQYPPPQSTGVQSTAPPMCTEEQARQIRQVNDPCVVYIRSTHVREHPERAFELECMGMMAYPNPQPPGHPVPLAECDRKYREDQARMGVPVRGMSEEQKANYRATWGGG